MAKKLFGKAGVIGFRMENKEEEEELTIALFLNVPKYLKNQMSIMPKNGQGRRIRKAEHCTSLNYSLHTRVDSQIFRITIIVARAISLFTRTVK